MPNMLISALAVLAGNALVAGSIVPRQSSAQAFCSSADGTYKLSQVDAPVSGNGDAGGMSTWDLTIQDTDSGRKQQIKGFGAAVTDATVTAFGQLSADKQSQLLTELMSSDGANFNLIRHTIASSDLSGDPAYTYDDNGGQPDTSLSGFNLGDRGNAMVAMLKAMKERNSDVTVLGSAWAPPGWMQLDGVLTGTTEQNNLDHQYADQYAQYFVKYVQAYEEAGVPIDAITIQNEPLNSRAQMPTLYIFADESAKLIQENVGPALRAAGLDTRIWAYDHNTDVPSYPQTVLDTAREYVSAVAWHCYADPLDWSVLSDFHGSNPDVEQYMTECWTSSEYTSWNQAASFTMGPLQNWASGSVAWTLGTDSNDGPYLSGGDACSTCRGLFTVEGGNYEMQIDYYMMGQFSKFMPRGAVVVGGTGSHTYEDGTGLESVATINPDGSRTVVIENMFGNDVYVTLKTDSGETWSGQVFSNSVVTWVLPASS